MVNFKLTTWIPLNWALGRDKLIVVSDELSEPPKLEVREEI